MAPLWTRARLERVMCLRFGFGHAPASPDTAAAAATRALRDGADPADTL